MKRKRIILILLVLIAAIAFESCRSQDRFGQRRTPKNCNTCTKWSK